MNLRNTVNRWVEWGVALKASPLQLGGLFAATVIIRNVLEAASLGILFEAPAFYLHFPVAYVFPMLGLVSLMHLFSGFPLAKLLKIMIMAWTLTLLPPIIDVFSGVTGDIGYFPLQRENAVWFLANFFNPAVTLPGTTAGIRVEAFLGCVLAGVFTWCVAPRHRVLRGILTTAAFMPMFLVFFTWPYLVQIVAERFFPVQEITQRFVQWRVVTEVPLHGAAHFTIFLVDMVPVSLLSIWMIRKLAPSQWALLKKASPDLAPGAAMALAGTAAAFTAIPRAAMTFGDTVGFAGALMAALWLLVSTGVRGGYRTGALSLALIVAWASGWNTLVAVSLAAALLNLPGPRWISRALSFPVLLFAAMSPAGVPSPSAAYLLLAAAATLPGLFRQRGAGLLLSLPVMALAVLNPPADLGRGRIQGLERQADSFFRSGMSTHGHASAMKVAASGGGFRTLAEGAHLTGMHNRAEWAYQVGTALGDSSPEMLKVGVNLASTAGDSLLLWTRAMNYMDVTGERGAEAAELLLGMAASRGDTAFLGLAHAGAGLSQRLLVLYSRAHMALGDSLGALSYARAALSSPGATQSTWAQAVEVTGITGGNYDSLFTLSGKWFGFSLEIALARLRAGIGGAGPPDREDLLERCLILAPDNISVLETAASWHLAAGNPERAMNFALRAVAAQIVPTRRVLVLAIRSAEAAGRRDIAAACDRYARSVYP